MQFCFQYLPFFCCVQALGYLFNLFPVGPAHLPCVGIMEISRSISSSSSSSASRRHPGDLFFSISSPPRSSASCRHRGHLCAQFLVDSDPSFFLFIFFSKVSWGSSDCVLGSSRSSAARRHLGIGSMNSQFFLFPSPSGIVAKISNSRTTLLQLQNIKNLIHKHSLQESMQHYLPESPKQTQLAPQLQKQAGSTPDWVVAAWCKCCPECAGFDVPKLHQGCDIHLLKDAIPLFRAIP